MLRDVYMAFKEYGSNAIRSFYKDSDGSVYVVDEDSSPLFKSLLDSVWNRYKMYDGIRLSEMTHRQGTAWYKAAKKNQDFLSDEDILNEEAFVQ